MSASTYSRGGAVVFVDALRDSPEALLKVVGLASRRCQALGRRLRDLVLRDAAAKCAGLLLDLAREFGRESKDGRVIEIVRTHQEVAEERSNARRASATPAPKASCAVAGSWHQIAHPAKGAIVCVGCDVATPCTTLG